MRAIRILLAAATLLSASAASAQSAEDAKVFLKDMLLSQGMGLPQNGNTNIDQVAFKDDCTMVMSAQSQFFIVVVNFKKAYWGPLDSIAPTSIIVQRGVTIYRARHLLQAEDSSTINFQFYTLDLAPRVFNAMNVLHAQCYSSGYKF